MSEKYFVCSESELEASWEANWNGTQEEASEAEAACRARPVEELGIRIRDKGPEVMWIEVKK